MQWGQASKTSKIRMPIPCCLYNLGIHLLFKAQFFIQMLIDVQTMEVLEA